MASLLEVRNLATHFFTPDGVVKAVDGISYHVRVAMDTVDLSGLQLLELVDARCCKRDTSSSYQLSD